MLRSFTGFRPSPRYDDTPWTEVLIYEEMTENAVFNSLIDTIALDPIDPDPADPLPRNFSTTAAILPTGWYKLVFRDAALNEDPADPVRFPAGGYPSAAELVGQSNLDALTSMSFEDQLTLWLASKVAIEEYTGQIFDFEEATTKIFDGSGSRKQYLPKRLEVLDELSVSGAGLVASDVSVTEDGSALVVLANAGFGSYYERAMMAVQDYPALKFTYGFDTITATGDWGWADFPDAVSRAMLLDMEDTALGDSYALSQTLRAYRKLGLRDVSQGNLSASLGPPQLLSDRVRGLLEPYVWQGQVGVVV